MSEARWKAYISGKKYGPVDDETVRQWIAEHRVTASTQLWRPGMARWDKAREVPEFSLYFEETMAAMPALEDNEPPAEQAPPPAAEPVAAPAPAAQPAPAQPAPVQLPLEAPASLYGDDDAPTVVQASPFLDVDDKQKDETIRVQPTAPERVVPRAEPKMERPVAAPAAASRVQAAEAPRRPVQPGSITRAKPGLPIFPFILSLLALVPAASFGFLLASGLITTDDVLRFALAAGTVLGLLLIMIPPLFFSMGGLAMGLLGGLIALGCWVAFVIVWFGLDDPIGTLRTLFIDAFEGWQAQGIVTGALAWSTVLVSVLAIIYYASSGKYRRRARA